MDRGYTVKYVPRKSSNKEKSMIIFLYANGIKLLDVYVYNIDESYLGIFLVSKNKV